MTDMSDSMEVREAIEVLDFRPSLRQTMWITPTAVESGGAISRVEIEMEGRQGGPPRHVHPNQREIYTVEEGALTVSLGGETHVVTAGSSIEIPEGAVHGFSNPSDAPVRFRADHLPALRFEEYIRHVHRTVAGRKATLPVVLRIVRIESSYGETILPPAGPPRLVGKLLSSVGALARFPTGDELSSR